MDAKFSDLSEKQFRKEQCYKVTILNIADTTELKFDMAISENTETIENAIKLAIQHGCKWEVAAWMKKKKD